MSVYLVALIDIHDAEKYMAYQEGFDWAGFQALGGEALIVSDEPNVLEGTWEHGRLVMLRFPSDEALQEWYESDSYRQVREIRWANATSNLSVHPELAGL